MSKHNHRYRRRLKGELFADTIRQISKKRNPGNVPPRLNHNQGARGDDQGAVKDPAVQYDEMNVFLEEFRNGDPRRLIIFETNLYAVVKFILERASDILPEVEEFARASPKLLPFILNGPKTDIIPQADQKRRNGPVLRSSAGKGRGNDRAVADDEHLETCQNAQLPSKPTLIEEEAELDVVWAADQPTDTLEDHTSAVLPTSPGDVVEQTPTHRPREFNFNDEKPRKRASTSASTSASPTQTQGSAGEQRPAKLVATTASMQGPSFEKLSAHETFQLANNGIMSQAMQYGMQMHPHQPFISNYPFSLVQTLPQMSMSPHQPYIPPVQAAMMNGGTHFLPPHPVPQWIVPSARHPSLLNPHHPPVTPVQPRQSRQSPPRMHVNQSNGSVKPPPEKHV